MKRENKIKSTVNDLDRKVEKVTEFVERMKRVQEEVGAALKKA